MHRAGEESSGLGLGIVRDILSEYGIELTVDQAEGHCRISFIVPLGPADAVAPFDGDPIGCAGDGRRAHLISGLKRETPAEVSPPPALNVRLVCEA